MKILLGLSSFYPGNSAGTENYVLNLAKELQKNNFEVSIVIPSVGKKIETYIYEEINVYNFYVPLKLSTLELNGLDKISGIDEFSKILDNIKPDIFHLHSLSRSFHAEHIKIAKQKKIKTVFTGHLGGTFCVNADIQLFQKESCDAYVNKNRCLACFIKNKKKYSIILSKIFAIFINLIIKTSLKYKFPAFNIVIFKLQQLEILKKFSDANIAIAPWLNKAFKINNFENVFLVNQGINSKFIEEKIEKLDKDKIELIFIGRMHPDKGVDLLIEALVEFKSVFNLTVITIPFNDENDFYNKIKIQFFELGFTNWLEKLPQNEVSKRLSFADILILPSTKNEAAPLVILEAFAKKIPVIGSDYIAIPDMVKHNFNGLIFKNGDVNSLKQQLKRIIKEPNLLKSLSKNIEIPRTFKDITLDMIEIYNKI